MATIRDLQREGKRLLAEAGIATPGREASLLLGAILGRSEPKLLAHDDAEVDPRDDAAFLALVERRRRGEPFAYLARGKEFFGRPFAVDERVLIPRPETEELVEIVLALPLPERARVLDLGTGSGAIAWPLAAERPPWRVIAADLALDALACAHRNRARLGLASRTALVGGDLADAFDLGRFDLLVSNPPYVDPDDEALVAADVRTYEPAIALFAGDRGFALIDRLLDASRRLSPGAFLAFEFGFGQQEGLLRRAACRPWLDLVLLHDDHAGIPRDVVFKRRREAPEGND